MAVTWTKIGIGKETMCSLEVNPDQGFLGLHVLTEV